MAPGFDLWTWIADPVHGALSGLGGACILYLLKKLTGHKAPDAATPLDWSGTKVAHAYSVDALRKKLEVPDGTKIVVTDRTGVRQPAEFDPGPYSASKVDERLSGVRIGLNSGAEALQYRTTPFDLALLYPGLRSRDDFYDVEAAFSLNVRVDPRYPERLMTWHVAHDRQVTMDRIKTSVEGELKPQVTHAIRSLALDADQFELLLDGKKPEFQTLLNESFGQHGLIAMITALKVHSADYEKHLKQRSQYGDEIRSSKIQELLRLARIEKAQGDAAAEDAVELLIQEGQLKKLARMKELKEAQAYQQERVEAAQVSAKEKHSSEGPRHEVLVELEKLREQRKPFSVDMRIVRPGGGSRDIAIHPPAYTAQNQMGAPLQLSITSDISGYLYLLNLGTSGKLWRLLPNPWRMDNRIDANRTILVPNGEFELKFEGKSGTEVVMAIVSANRVDKLERLPVNADGMSLSPEAAARDIKVLGQTLSGSGDWAEATLLIQTEAGKVSSVSAS